MAICPKCGKELPDGAKFCAYCGSSLESEQTAPVANPQPQPAPTPAAQPVQTPVAQPVQMPAAQPAPYGYNPQPVNQQPQYVNPQPYGYPVQQGQPYGAPQQPYGYPQYAPQPVKEDKSLKNAILGFILGLISAIAGVIAFILGNGMKAKPLDDIGAYTDLFLGGGTNYNLILSYALCAIAVILGFVAVIASIRALVHRKGIVLAIIGLLTGLAGCVLAILAFLKVMAYNSEMSTRNKVKDGVETVIDWVSYF